MARFRHPERPRSSRNHIQTQQIEPNRSIRVLDPDRTPKIHKKVKSILYEQLSCTWTLYVYVASIDKDNHVACDQTKGEHLELVRVRLKKSNYFFWISQKWLDFDTQSVPGALETSYRHSKSSRIVLSGSWTQIGPEKSTKKVKSILYEQLRLYCEPSCISTLHFNRGGFL